MSFLHLPDPILVIQINSFEFNTQAGRELQARHVQVSVGVLSQSSE